MDSQCSVVSASLSSVLKKLSSVKGREWIFPPAGGADSRNDSLAVAGGGRICSQRLPLRVPLPKWPARAVARGPGLRNATVHGSHSVYAVLPTLRSALEQRYIITSSAE